VLSIAKEQMERKHKLMSEGYGLEQVCFLMKLEKSEIWKTGNSRRLVAARSLLCYWAVRELDISMTEMSKRFGIGGVFYATAR
jgi:7-cyano-7-deazaguanine synthase in queuosine biosynthesis